LIFFFHNVGLNIDNINIIFLFISILCIVFDFDSKTFGTYKKIGKRSLFKRIINGIFSSTFFLIIAILIIICLVGYIYYILSKKQRRKRANELIDDDYDYLPNKFS